MNGKKKSGLGQSGFGFRHKCQVSGTVAVVLTGLLLSGCSLLPKEEEVLAPPLVQPAPPQYDTVKVVKKTIINGVMGTANFIPVNSVDLSFKSPTGALAAINVKLLDTVHAGQTLMQLDTGDLNYTLQAAQIQLEKDQLNLNRDLQKGDATTIEQDKLTLKNDQLNISKYQQQMSDAQLTAPMDGVVSSITDHKVGDRVNAYETLVTVVDPSQLQLIYTAATLDTIGKVDLGMPVNITYKGKKYTGTVVQTPRSVTITPANKPNADLYKKSVIISMSEVPGDAKLGDTADIQIITEQKDNALVIPIEALGSYMGNHYVQMLDGSSKKQVPVQKGIQNQTEVEILKGVKEGDTVIKR